MKLVQSMGIFFLLTMFLVFTGCSIDDVTLESITVTHPNASVSENSTELFTATGNYSDGTTKDLTSSVSWSSDNAAVTFITTTAGEATIGEVTSETTVNITATTTIDNSTISGKTTLIVTSTSGNPTTATVTINNGTTTETDCDNAFSPPSVSIAVGGTVTWINNDNLQHTVESVSTTDTFSSACPPDGTAISTGELFIDNLSQNGGTQSHIFNTAGTYRYVCGILGHQMRGTVIVE